MTLSAITATCVLKGKCHNFMHGNNERFKVSPDTSFNCGLNSLQAAGLWTSQNEHPLYTNSYAELV